MSYTKKDKELIIKGIASVANELEQEYENICYAYIEREENKIINQQFVEHGGSMDLINQNKA